MNNIYKTLIVVLTLLFVSCSKEKPILEEEVTVGCQTSDLSIDELSKFSSKVYNNTDNSINEELSSKWSWRIKNDTIEVSGKYFTLYNTSHFLFLKNDENCLDFLMRRYRSYDDNIIIDSDTGNVISGGEQWSDSYSLPFEVQEYIDGERLVCKVGNTKIWIDFTSDLKDDKWQFNIGL